MHQDLTIPESAVFMTTNRDFRLSSLSGPVINFKKDVPTRVAPNVYAEAVAIGAIDCDPEEHPPADAPAPKVPDPRIAEAAKLEAEAKVSYIKQACLILMERGDSTDFKADGYPKANKLIAELAPQCPHPKAQEIQEVFDGLRENVDLIDTA